MAHTHKKAFRTWKPQELYPGELFYVAQLPGDGGVDYGYTSEHAKAIDLTPYWQRRFAAYCRHVGSEAHFVD